MHVYYVTFTESILSELWLALSDCKIEDQNINICLNATKSLVKIKTQHVLWSTPFFGMFWSTKCLNPCLRWQDAGSSMSVAVSHTKTVWRWVGTAWRNCPDCTTGTAAEVRFLLWLVLLYGKLTCLRLVFVECTPLLSCESLQ